MSGQELARHQDPGGRFGYEIEEEDGIIVGLQWGFMDADDARRLIAELRRIAAQQGGPYRHALDMQRATGLSPEARRLMVAAILAKDSPVSKFAPYGGAFALRCMMNLYARIANVPMRVFATREEAMQWLRQ